MHDQTSLMARVLYGAGARQNDVVAIVSENRFEYPAIVFGSFYLGVIVAPASSAYTERELNHTYNNSRVSIKDQLFGRNSVKIGHIYTTYNSVEELHIDT